MAYEWVRTMANAAATMMSPVSAYFGAFTGVRKEANDRKFKYLLELNDPTRLEKLADSYEKAAMSALYGRSGRSRSTRRSGSGSDNERWTRSDFARWASAEEKAQVTREDKARVATEKADAKLERWVKGHERRLSDMEVAQQTYGDELGRVVQAVSTGTGRVTNALDQIAQSSMSTHEKAAVYKEFETIISNYKGKDQTALMKQLTTHVFENHLGATPDDFYEDQLVSREQIERKKQHYDSFIPDDTKEMKPAVVRAHDADAAYATYHEEIGIDPDERVEGPDILSEGTQTGKSDQDAYDYYMAKALEAREKAQQMRANIPEIFAGYKPYAPIGTVEDTDRTPFMQEVAAEQARRPTEFERVWEESGLEDVGRFGKRAALGGYLEEVAQGETERRTTGFIPYVGESDQYLPEKYAGAAASSGFVFEELGKLAEAIQAQGAGAQTDEKATFIYLYGILLEDEEFQGRLRENPEEEAGIRALYAQALIDYGADKGARGLYPLPKPTEEGGEVPQDDFDMGQISNDTARRTAAESVIAFSRSQRGGAKSATDIPFSEVVLGKIETIENPSDKDLNKAAQVLHGDDYGDLLPEEQRQVVSAWREAQYKGFSDKIEGIAKTKSKLRLLGDWASKIPDQIELLEATGFNPETSGAFLQHMTAGVVDAKEAMYSSQVKGLDLTIGLEGDEQSRIEGLQGDLSAAETALQGAWTVGEGQARDEYTQGVSEAYTGVKTARDPLSEAGVPLGDLQAFDPESAGVLYDASKAAESEAAAAEAAAAEAAAAEATAAEATAAESRKKAQEKMDDATKRIHDLLYTGDIDVGEARELISKAGGEIKAETGVDTSHALQTGGLPEPGSTTELNQTVTETPLETPLETAPKPLPTREEPWAGGSDPTFVPEDSSPEVELGSGFEPQVISKPLSPATGESYLPRPTTPEEMEQQEKQDLLEALMGGPLKESPTWEEAEIQNVIRTGSAGARREPAADLESFDRLPDASPEGLTEAVEEEEDFDWKETEALLADLQGILSPSADAPKAKVGLPEAQERSAVFQIPGKEGKEFIMQVDRSQGSEPEPLSGRLARLYGRPAGSDEWEDFKPTEPEEQDELYDLMYKHTQTGQKSLLAEGRTPVGEVPLRGPWAEEAPNVWRDYDESQYRSEID